MTQRPSDDGVRAMLLTAILVLAASIAMVAAARNTPRSVVEASVAGFPPALPTIAVPMPSNTTVPSTAAAPSATVLALDVASATPVPSATPAPSPTASATAVAGDRVPVGTRPPAPTPLGSETSAVPATATATNTPVPTPTKTMMSLRTDLPAMSLQDWPRPANDDGWGMHFIINAYPSEQEIDLNIQRLVDMRIKWAVVIYGDEIQLQKLAPRFRDAGITVVWRRMLRPYDRYYDWGRDIAILKNLGVAPYMQAYNEPEVPAEWPDGKSNEAVFLDNLVSACQDIYNAGGYVGLQFASSQWLRDALHEIKARNGQAVFGRMFFVPHSYGMNHPPDYTEDINAVLSFRIYAMVFQQEIGMVPPMIVGEGGWKYGATDDARFPKVTDELHRDYYVALYNWFRTGKLSNGEPLPDYLFAFCPWLIAHKMDDNAFYDSFAGDRTMTIAAIKAIPPFVRHFSWG